MNADPPIGGESLGPYPFAVRSLALIPMLMAALAVVCVFRRPDRRWLWAGTTRSRSRSPG